MQRVCINLDYDQQCEVGQGKKTQHWYCKDKVLYCSPDSLATQSASKTDFHLKGLLHCFSTCIEITGNNRYCFILKNVENCKENFQRVKKLKGI